LLDFETAKKNIFA